MHDIMGRMARIVLGCALLAGTLAAQGTYQNDLYGFSIKPVPQWEQMPVEPTVSEFMIARWTSPRDVHDLPATMNIYAFDKAKAKADAEKFKGVGEYDRGPLPFWIHKTFKSWLAAEYPKAALGKPRPLKIKAPKEMTVQAEVYELEPSSGYRRGDVDMGNWYLVVALVDAPDHEFVVEMRVHEKGKRQHRGIFLGVANSIRLHEREAAEQPAAASGDGQLSAREKARQQALASVNVPGWCSHEAGDYIIVTDLPERKNAFVIDIAQRLQAMRGLYERDFPPAKEIEAVSIVRLCKDRETYMNYGAPGGSAGYWSAWAKELVLYAGGAERDTHAVLNHEAFHQYIFYSCGELSPHSWFNEGYGDYYSGARITGGTALIKPFLWRQDTLTAAIRKGEHVPLKDIIRYTQGDYYSRSDLCYSEGWSIIYFLNQGLVGENHPWSSILPTYFRVLQETGDRNAAVDAAFKDVDLEALEAAWAEFTTRGKPAKPPA